MRTRSSSTSTSPISEALPGRTLSQPAGSPASSQSAASRSAETGVWLAGFSTTAHPAASAGASLWATRLSGKLKGVIAPITPIGTRTVQAMWPSPGWVPLIGTDSPESVRASPAASAYVLTARAASTRAAFMGLPASAQIVCASSSPCSRTSCETRSRISARRHGGSGSRIASTAASIARRASSAPARATVATTSPE